MGYDLTIGEAEFKVDKVGDDFVDNIQEECIRVTVAEIKHDNAPAFGEPTDYTNVRWPSYSSWAIFCEFAELEHVFYEMDEHDNCTGHLRWTSRGYAYNTISQRRSRQGVQASKDAVQNS